MSGMLIASQIMLWIAMAAMALVMAAMLRQLGVLFERIAPAGALSMNAKLSVGDAAPRFRIPALDGAMVDIGAPRDDEKSVLLFFVSADCPICKQLLPAVRAFDRAEKNLANVVFVGSQREGGQAKLAARHNIAPGAFVASDEMGMAYAVAKLPYAVLIAADGAIAAMGLVNNREHLESLIEAKEAGVASIQDYFKKSA
ncbi:MAG: redoxin family protein [Pseudomonadota bacterium]